MMIKSMKYMLLYAVATSGAATLSISANGDFGYGGGDARDDNSSISLEVEQNT